MAGMKKEEKENAKILLEDLKSQFLNPIEKMRNIRQISSRNILLLPIKRFFIDPWTIPTQEKKRPIWTILFL